MSEKLASLEDAAHVLQLIKEKKLTHDHMAWLFSSGRLADFLEASQRPEFLAIDRSDFQQRLVNPCWMARKHKPGPDIATVSSPVAWPVWKRLKLGTPGLKCGPDFIRTLEQAGHKINDWVRRMLLHSDFTVASAETEIDLVVVSVADLGFTKATRYDKICARAIKRGLELCPAETGPQLRLQYLDQPLGEWLRVAMEPIRDSGGRLRVFLVEHGDDGLWLGSDDGSLSILCYPGSRFVFRGRKLSLAA